MAILAFAWWVLGLQGDPDFDLAIPTKIQEERAVREARIALGEEWARAWESAYAATIQEMRDEILALAKQQQEMREQIIQGGLIPVIDAKGDYVGDMTKQEARIVLGIDIP